MRCGKIVEEARRGQALGAGDDDAQRARLLAPACVLSKFANHVPDQMSVLADSQSPRLRS